ncbi:MAG: TonB-dependent receptor [Qipengyuania sp.]|nr:TonB-dependent receptor [Qipengyuania sp.]
MRFRTVAYSAAFLSSVSVSAMALAQAAPPDPAGEQGATDVATTPAAPPTEARESGIADIVVTATRREERLQDIPVTVTAIAGSSIAEAGVREVRTLTQVIPNFNGGRNQNVMQPSIRGVGSSGTSVGDEANVAVYVDGVYQGDPYSTQIDLVEVARVEVLRGPQGTVFGRNATGGLVNVITPDPSFQTRGRVSARYGRMREDASDIDLRGYFTGALSEAVAADLALLYRKNDGYITNLTGGEPFGETRVASVRGKLLFERDGASAVITAAYVDSDDETASAQPFRGNTTGAAFAGVIVPTEPWNASLSAFPVSDYNRLDLSLRMRFELGAVNLETTSAYMKTQVHQVADSDASNIRLGDTDMRVFPRTLTQEIRLLSTGNGPLTWITGLYGYFLDGTQPVTIVNRASPTAPIVPLKLSPTAGTASYAAFAEGTYRFGTSLYLTLGGRYTTEERRFSQKVNGNQLPFGEVDANFNKFTYRAAVRYEFAEDANLYASYGTGFKSGVFNTFGTSPTAVRPETIEAAEIGLKADPTRWLRTNIALFHYNYDDLQATARAADNSFILQNAATAKIYGGEFEATAVPVDDLTLRLALAYTHAEYEKFPNAQVFTPRPTGGNIVSSTDVSGNRLVRTPEFTVNLGGNYGFDMGGGRGHIAGNLFRSSRVYYDYLNALSQDPYTMLSGEVGWTTAGEQVTFRLFASNLTNAKVAQQISPGPQGTYIIYERPRRVGIGIDYRF